MILYGLRCPWRNTGCKLVLHQIDGIPGLYVTIIIVGLGAAIVFTSVCCAAGYPSVSQGCYPGGTLSWLREYEPLAETGPRELVSLARNLFLASEISVLLENRTTLMAGISRDLRTPHTHATCLALLPETVDEVLIRRFEHNLESMDELIRDALRLPKVPAKKTRSSSWLHLSKIFSVRLSKMLANS